MKSDATAAAQLEAIRGLLEKIDPAPSSLLPSLHAVQDALGHVPDSAVSLIAARLNLSQADVHGALGFYPWFRRIPGGRHTVRLCRAEACQARGAAALAEHAERSLGCGWHETSADGAFTLEPLHCLGLCASGPSLMIDGEVHARMTPEHFDRLMAELRRAP